MRRQQVLLVLLATDLLLLVLPWRAPACKDPNCTPPAKVHSAALWGR